MIRVKHEPLKQRPNPDPIGEHKPNHESLTTDELLARARLMQQSVLALESAKPDTISTTCPATQAILTGSPQACPYPSPELCPYNQGYRQAMADAYRLLRGEQ